MPRPGTTSQPAITRSPNGTRVLPRSGKRFGSSRACGSRRTIWRGRGSKNEKSGNKSVRLYFPAEAGAGTNGDFDSPLSASTLLCSLLERFPLPEHFGEIVGHTNRPVHV